MSLQWIEVYLWPDRDVVHFFSPDGFKAKFATTRVIIPLHASYTYKFFNEFVILGDGVFAIYC